MCDCRTRINEKLVEYNTKIKPVFSLGGNSVAMPWPIETTQIETGRGKKKAVGLFASFCPFCGVPLSEESSAD